MFLVIEGWKILNYLGDWDKLWNFLGGDFKVVEVLSIVGFVGKFGGWCDVDEFFVFQEKDEVGYWWFSSVDGYNCWVFFINFLNVFVLQFMNIYSCGYGFSICFICQ